MLGGMLLEDMGGPLVAGYLLLNTELCGGSGLTTEPPAEDDITGPPTEGGITGPPILLMGARGPFIEGAGGPLLIGG